MSDPIEIPFDELISVLLEDSASLYPRFLHRLSDLEPGEAGKLAGTWPRLPLSRRRELMEDLVELGADEDLLSFEAIGRHAIQDEDPRVRTLAVRLLWEFDHDDLMQIFLDLLEADPEPEVRAAAASGLGQFVYLGELEELPEEERENLEDRLLQSVNQDKAQLVRRKALEALGYSSRDEVPVLIQQAFDSQDRDWMATALLAMGRSMDSRWEQPILSMLNSKTPALRAEAARAAGELEIPSSVATLIDLTEDSEEEISSAAIWSLSQIGGEQARQTLENLFRETEDEEDTNFLEIALDNLAFTEGLQPFSILDVDDDKTERELYEMMLNEEGDWDLEGDNGFKFDSNDEDFDLIDIDDFNDDDESLDSY